MRYGCSIILLVAVLGFADLHAQDLARLKTLPSKPSPHTEKIKSLADGAWLNLGRPAADPKWGEARGRSWCQKMNFAPDLRAAYLTGEGVHAFIKPDGYYMDDHFLYDINAHAWVCLHPGVKAGEDQGLKLSETGLLVNAKGDPIPCGLLAHNYDQTTYDTDQKKFAFIPKGGSTGWWVTMKCKQVKELQKPASAKMSGKGWSPWYYNVAMGAFEREVLKGQGPITTAGAGCFMYLPAHKKFFLRETKRHDNWLYDASTKTWSKIAKLPVAIGTDAVSCYDAKRGVLYIAGGNNAKQNGVLLSYDAGIDQWKRLADIPEKPRLTGNSGHMTYDTANDVVVVNIGGIKQLNFYAPAEDKWLADQAVPAQTRGAAFYDTEQNVHYYFAAGDSRDKGEIWVYRYK